MADDIHWHLTMAFKVGPRAEFTKTFPRKFKNQGDAYSERQRMINTLEINPDMVEIDVCEGCDG